MKLHTVLWFNTISAID